jgi:hypothetical protein
LENESAQGQHDMIPSTAKQSLLRDNDAASLPLQQRLIEAEFSVELCAYACLEDICYAALDLFSRAGVAITTAV